MTKDYDKNQPDTDKLIDSNEETSSNEVWQNPWRDTGLGNRKDSFSNEIPFGDGPDDINEVMNTLPAPRPRPGRG
ncbi:hypothetical protein J1G18_07335 [Pseudomonas sp. MIS38]|uniref:hypothetical protein n=1 Tax=Pseudomonas sp. MIS38 TaxID=91465 RepID=UPI001CA6AF9D|nr:hypothetical protein [Pseudomonas sp. MIS38]MBY8957094.1 hypothetical protein [Pseudomonas sp. MIS38]